MIIYENSSALPVIHSFLIKFAQSAQHGIIAWEWWKLGNRHESLGNLMWTQRTDWELGARRKKEEGGESEEEDEEEEEERRGVVGRGRKFVDAFVVVCLQVRSPFVASLAINCSVVEMSGRWENGYGSN